MNFVVYFVSASFAFIIISANRVNSPICPEVNGIYPVYIPDKDCSKFWECSNGIPYLFECPRGLLFNVVINACDVPARVQCLEENNEDSPNERNPSEDNNREESKENGPEGKYDRYEECEDIEIVCPIIDGEHPVYIPLPDDSRFCQCSKGKPYLRHCPGDLKFNKELNVCDWPDFAGGAGENVKNEINNDDDNRGQIQGGNRNNHEICLNLAIECPLVDGDRPIYIPLSNLSQFCECSNGVPYLHTCPAGLLFNPILNVCDWSNQTYTSNGNETEDNNSKKQSNDDDSGTKSNNVCFEAVKVCPAVDGKYPTYIPLTNCSQFCECSNGKPYLQNCPDGLHFNPVLNVCNWPGNAGCARDNHTNANDGNVANSYSGEDNDLDSEYESNIVDMSEVCLQTDKDCPLEDGDIPVYIPLPGCFEFCQCSNGKPYLHRCPNGLHFNPILNVCDWPDEVLCKEIPN